MDPPFDEMVCLIVWYARLPAYARESQVGSSIPFC